MKYVLETVIDPASIDYDDMQQHLAGKPDASVLFLAGYCTEGGFNRVTVDPDATVEWAHLGAQTDDPLCMAWYGTLFQNSYYPEAIKKADKEILLRSLPWLEDEAKKGHPYAQTILGLALINGRGGIKIDLKRGFSLTQQAAEQGEPFALNNIGHYYTQGRGNAVNWDAAYEAYSKAAAKGLAIAQYYFGNLHASDRKDKKADPKAAQEFWIQAANQGYGPAQFKLSEHYAATDPEKAFDFCEKAAQSGLASARFRLGEYYNKGKGTPRDLAKAFVVFSELLDEDSAKSPARCIPNSAAQKQMGLALRVLRMAAKPIVEDGQRKLVWPGNDMVVVDDNKMRERLRKIPSRALNIKRSI